MKNKKTISRKRTFFTAALAAMMMTISGTAYAAEPSVGYSYESNTCDTVYADNGSSDAETPYATYENSDEDTAYFSIPISDNVSRGIYRLDVSLTGDDVNHTVSATVKNNFAIWFSTVDVTITLYSDRTGTPVARASMHDNDLNLGEYLTVTHTGVTESAKYYAVISGTGNGDPIYYSTYHIPFNKKGKKYPTEVTSPVTKQPLPYDFPMTMTKLPVSQRVKWTTAEKDRYAERNGYDLTGCEVHHIIPREYGGTNVDSNLIPIATTDHRSIVSPWWVNY